jgi:hypothetical protein
MHHYNNNYNVRANVSNAFGLTHLLFISERAKQKKKKKKINTVNLSFLSALALALRKR